MTRVGSGLRAGLPWAAPAACGGLLLAGYLIGRHAGMPAEVTDPEVLILVSVSIGFAVVGALILGRHPRHRLGWLYVGTATAMATALFVFPYAWYGLVTEPGPCPARSPPRGSRRGCGPSASRRP